MRFDDAVEAFTDALEAAKKSPHTVAAYRRDLRLVGDRAAEALDRDRADLDLDDLDVRVLRRAFGRRAADASAATMSRTHSSWTAFYGFLRSEGEVAANPMDEIERARTGTSAVRSIDVDDLAGRLLRTAGASDARSAWPRRDAAIVAVFAQTGVRLAELVGLTVGSRTGEPGARQLTVIGKGRKARTLPITPGLDRLLDAYLAERWERYPDQRPGDHRAPLFVHPSSGGPVSARQVQYLVERLYREAGIRGSVPEGALVHALRHSFAMDLLDHGADVVELQTLLGHSSLNTTRRYLTARPDRLRDAIATSAASAAIDAAGSDEGAA
ncbi:MAG: tyrosine-type recombinase/integrase [Acidimicrobiia bacterium]